MNWAHVGLGLLLLAIGATVVLNVTAPSHQVWRQALLWGGITTVLAGLYLFVGGFVVWE